MGLKDDFPHKVLRAILFGDSKRLLDDVVRDTRLGNHQVRRKCLACREQFWGEKVDILCSPCNHARYLTPTPKDKDTPS